MRRELVVTLLAVVAACLAGAVRAETPGPAGAERPVLLKAARELMEKARYAGYVTLQGRATVVADPAEKASRWKEDWAAFYKEKNRGDDYVSSG